MLASSRQYATISHVTNVKLSVCIPYKARLDNLKIALEALARQTMNADDFEVIIGAMEYSTELITAGAAFCDRLNVITVSSSREFHIPRARNLAMRSATGDVVVQMDADTMLQPDALQRLYDRCFAFGQRVCAVGQVVGYGNNQDGDVESVELRPYNEHLAALQEMAAASDWPADPRFRVVHNIPWAFAWTGLIALPRAAVTSDQLYFDESFLGWGVDDLEWGYRVCASGIPIVLRPDVYGLHLPHKRDAAANGRTGAANHARFLRKWPTRDVELARVFGDTGANDLWPQYLADLASASGAVAFGVAVGPARTARTPRTARTAHDGSTTVRIGVPLDRTDNPVGREHLAGFDDPDDVKILPLTGMALPYESGQVASCRIDARIQRLPAAYRDAVLAEAERVSRLVVLDDDHSLDDHS
jgi:glycosyltransferase involved in cell wall biosynthesis